VPHDIVPFLHGFPDGVHASPALQLMQLPFEHTRFVPHPVPFESALPLSMHVGVPPAHDNVPL
jgi:hypothetical protein